MRLSAKLLIRISLLIALCSATLGYAETLRTVTGLNYVDKERAFDGYTVFSVIGAATTYALDMDGNVVHSWPIGGNPRLLDNGNLLAGTRGRYTELDWDGDIVWSYEETRSNYVPHHDFVRRYNPKLGEMTTFYIANRDVSQEECVAMGCDPANDYTGASIDTIVEINMDGEIIWEWRFVDHMVQDRYPDKANYVGEGKTIADYPGRLNVNLPGRPVRRDWLHLNAMDYNSELDQVMFDAVGGEVYIIDHGATFVPGEPEQSIALAAGPSGDFLWRFGDPARYEQGDPPSIKEDWTGSSPGHKQIGGVHDVQWIADGLPGAGNILLFNNAQYLWERTPQSYILQINPYLDANGNDTGRYVNPPDAGYYLSRPVEPRNTHKQPRNISNQIVWSYGAGDGQNFFSHIASGAERLPNGNTFICASTTGHIFEVTANGDLVWEYINPVTTDGQIFDEFIDPLPMDNALFRAHRYSAAHPAFAGRELTSLGPIGEQ
ncbi:MAG: aryl-sulfate sulfotransferase [Candidatus Rariloculaceae bacterium]